MWLSSYMCRCAQTHAHTYIETYQLAQPFPIKVAKKSSTFSNLYNTSSIVTLYLISPSDTNSLQTKYAVKFP